LFLNNFVNTRGYLWIPADMKKIGGYPYNGYPTDMGTSTRRIFIQRVGCGGATTRPVDIPTHKWQNFRTGMAQWFGRPKSNLKNETFYLKFF